jgi:hypothetical protein
MPTQASQSISDFQGDNLSVNMFGAVGDGITDDTASCQAALDFAGPLGLSVFFPAGVYIISAALRCYTLTPTYTPYHGLALEGAGEGATTLLIKSGSVPSGTNCCNGISVSNPFDTSATNPTLRVTIRGMTIDGNKAHVTQPNYATDPNSDCSHCGILANQCGNAGNGLAAVAVVAGGSGNLVGDVLTLNQNSPSAYYTINGHVTVTAVSAGVVTAVSISSAGFGFTLGAATSTNTRVGFSGTNATFNVTALTQGIPGLTLTNVTIQNFWYMGWALGLACSNCKVSNVTAVNCGYNTSWYGYGAWQIAGSSYFNQVSNSVAVGCIHGGSVGSNAFFNKVETTVYDSFFSFLLVAEGGSQVHHNWITLRSYNPTNSHLQVGSNTHTSSTWGNDITILGDGAAGQGIYCGQASSHNHIRGTVSNGQIEGVADWGTGNDFDDLTLMNNSLASAGNHAALVFMFGASNGRYRGRCIDTQATPTQTVGVVFSAPYPSTPFYPAALNCRAEIAWELAVGLPYYDGGQGSSGYYTQAGATYPFGTVNCPIPPVFGTFRTPLTLQDGAALSYELGMGPVRALSVMDGIGYEVGDVLSLSEAYPSPPGGSATGAQATVLSTGVGGIITGAALSASGAGYFTGGTVTVSGGHGTSAAVSITSISGTPCRVLVAGPPSFPSGSSDIHIGDVDEGLGGNVYLHGGVQSLNLLIHTSGGDDLPVAATKTVTLANNFALAANDSSGSGHRVLVASPGNDLHIGDVDGGLSGDVYIHAGATIHFEIAGDVFDITASGVWNLPIQHINGGAISATGALQKSNASKQFVDAVAGIDYALPGGASGGLAAGTYNYGSGPIIVNADNANHATAADGLTSAFTLPGLPVYANNAAAVAAGMTPGQLYRTGANPDPLCVVH